MLKIGDTYSTEFIISQDQVNAFAELSGDKNPIHIDADYAATTNFKTPITHGIFAASLISKVLGTAFPGQGTLYLSQTLNFKRPVFPDKKYQAVFEVIETRAGKHIAKISTKYFDAETNKIVLDGYAEVKHSDLIG